MANITFGNYTPAEDKDDDPIDIVFGIFFDGTLNNKQNTKERENNTAIYKKYGIKTWKERQISEKKDKSYDNDWSNIARMSESCKDKAYPIYIEGIGTEDKQDDDQFGFAMGSKTTGVREKVKKGCDSLAKKIGKGGKIGVLTVDVFGFSRGAAAARNFVYEISKKKGKKYDDEDVLTKELLERGYLGTKFNELNIIVEKIEIRFLGIYDTVSSYDPTVDTIAGMINHNFSNDVKELHLNEINSARNVVHFVATDEHRENFDLTHTHIGEEKTFPGVHSDIRGSYLSEEEWVREIETDWTNKNDLKPFEDKLIAEGWYTKEQLYYHGGNAYFALSGKRFLWKTYSFIPLKFMVEKAIKAGCSQILLDKVNKNYSFSKDSLLLRVEKRLRNYVFDNGQPYSFKWFKELEKKYKGAKVPEQRYADYLREVEEQKDLRTLRNKYLHWSADRYATGMDPRSDRKRVTH